MWTFFICLYVCYHRRTEGGGRRSSAPPPFWDIVLRISRNYSIFLSIFAPLRFASPLFEFLCTPLYVTTTWRCGFITNLQEISLTTATKNYTCPLGELFLWFLIGFGNFTSFFPLDYGNQVPECHSRYGYHAAGVTGWTQGSSWIQFLVVWWVWLLELKLSI